MFKFDPTCLPRPDPFFMSNCMIHEKLDKLCPFNTNNNPQYISLFTLKTYHQVNNDSYDTEKVPFNTEKSRRKKHPIKQR